MLKAIAADRNRPHKHIQTPQDLNKDRNADDIFFTLPASGANGYAGCDAVFDKLNSGDLFMSSLALGAMVSGTVNSGPVK